MASLVALSYNMVCPPTAEAIAATASGLGCVGAGVIGLAAGAAVAGYVEIKLQEFEEKCKAGTYKVRWWTAQGIRVLIFGAGTALTTVAAYGLISTSIIATVGVASAGIGIAIVAVIGISFAIKRYLDMDRALKAQEKKDVCNALLGEFSELDDNTIGRLVKKHNIDMNDVTSALDGEQDDDVATQKYRRMRAILRNNRNIGV